ncbi:NAD(P)-binding domain-containing protein [Flavobacterium sp. 3-210]
MKIGIIGVGNINMDYAHRAAKLGYEVLISHSKQMHSLKEIIQNMGSNVKLVDMCDAAIAEIILLSLDWEELESSISCLPNMSEKIILHTNNPIFNFESSFSSLPVIIRRSPSEKIASLLPDAHVVRIFNKLQPIIINKNESNYQTEIFYIAKNQKVKNKVISFLNALDFSSTALTTVNEIDFPN